jgi:translation initiation factor IF-1
VNLGSSETTYSLTDFANFSGTIVEKLPNTEFLVKLTHFPDGTQVPEGKEVIVTAKLTGKIRDKKIKIAVYDTVTVSINMEGASMKQGYIIYRDRGKSPIPQKLGKRSGK